MTRTKDAAGTFQATWLDSCRSASARSHVPSELVDRVLNVTSVGGEVKIPEPTAELYLAAASPASNGVASLRSGFLEGTGDFSPGFRPKALMMFSACFGSGAVKMHPGSRFWFCPRPLRIHLRPPRSGGDFAVGTQVLVE